MQMVVFVRNMINLGADGISATVATIKPSIFWVELIKYASIIFDRFYEGLPIRKVTVCAGSLKDKKGTQLNLFENYENIKKDDEVNLTIDRIKQKYGKNSILKASSLLEDSTIKERNKKVGGHNA